MPQDYLLDNDYDLRIENGDFVVGESTNQHQDLLMILEKGELRQFPATGVGIKRFLNDDNMGDLYGEIIKQFEADGMKVKSLVIGSSGKVTIDAEYV